MEKADITAELVTRLVAEQFPHWAGLRVRPVAQDGWDNATFHLGDHMSVRLPSADWYVPQVEKEQRWLPVLAPQLPLPVPVPLAQGVPSAAFPRPWSVYQWLPGAHASAERIGDRVQFALDLANFLRALYGLDASAGPPAGRHSFNRGGALAKFDTQTRALIDELAADIDAAACQALWQSALASRWQQTAVWVHGDISATNVLVRDGRLGAVIDFGCLAVGDPACDLVIAWTFLAGADAAAFRDRIAMDEATWARARGWALWKALLTHRDGIAAGTADKAGAQFGWRTDARQLIAELCADADRPAL